MELLGGLMKRYTNICPACHEVLNDDDDLIRSESSAHGTCKYCGYTDDYSFWYTQNIEIFIAINAPWERMLSKVADKMEKYRDHIKTADVKFIMKPSDCCENCIASLPQSDSMGCYEWYSCTWQGYKDVKASDVCNQYKKAWD